MRRFTLYQIDAFTRRVFGGNPAGVVIDEAGALSAGEMASIAAENALSETAFLTPEGDDWAIRWFTPTVEVAFCGHATLASAHVLIAEMGRAGPLRFRTRQVGTLAVAAAGPGLYALDVPLIAPEAAEADPAALGQLFPGGWTHVFGNFENLFVELPTAADVAAFRADLAAIVPVAPQGLCITAAGGADHHGVPVDFTSRYFAPAAGIPEDPATGSTHATLVPWWTARLGARELAAWQASPRGGALSGRVEGERVILTGGAVTYLKGEIVLPDAAL